MATFFVAMSVGHGGKGAAHFEYIEREGKYRKKDKVYSESGHLPAWAATPKDFWESASAHDKRSYREIDFALPNELDREEQIKIAQDFVQEYLPDKAYTMAIHEPDSRITGQKNPHVHIMFSERIIDERTKDMPEEEFFKKCGKTVTGRTYGGAIKDRKWAGKGKGPMKELRNEIAERINAAYERNGLDIRISAKSIKEQKIEKYQAGDIEGAEQFKREKPYRAPVASFIRHAKEIAAVARGELDPETIKDPAARLRAYQELEKNVVEEIVRTIKERNEELNPNEAEIFMALDTEEKKLSMILRSFDGNQDGQDLAAWYQKQLENTKKKKEQLRQKLRKEIREGRDFDIRDFSLMKAEDQIEKEAPLPRAREPEREIRAISFSLANVEQKIHALESETLQQLAEKEADRRTDGKITEINKKIAELDYTFLPRPDLDGRKKKLLAQKEKLLLSVIRPEEYAAFRQKEKEAQKKIWELRRMNDRLEIHLRSIEKQAVLSHETVEKILAEQARIQTSRALQKAPDEENKEKQAEPVRRFPEVPEPESLKREIPSPDRKGTEKKEKTAFPRRRETPDMRTVSRSIGDLERTVARAEKKIAALQSKTMRERMEAETDRLTNGRLTELRNLLEAQRRPDGELPDYAKAEYTRGKELLIRAKITPAVRKKLEKEAARDAARAVSLFRYVRRSQKKIVDLRTVLTVLQTADRLNKEKARLETIAALTTADFLRQAIREQGLSPAPSEQTEKERLTPDAAVRDFYEKNLPPAVRTRAAELEEANRLEKERLAGEIRRMEEHVQIRQPFVSRYQEQRKELLDKAAKRRAFLYEETVLKLNRDPKKLSYYFDQAIDQKTDGALSGYVRIWTDADQSVRRMETAKEQAADTLETLQTWKDVWTKKPLARMQGKGHRADSMIRDKKQERQKAQAAITLLRKDYNTSEVWKEARLKYDGHVIEERRLMKELWEQRRKLEKDRSRKQLSYRAHAVLDRIAKLADRLLGPKARGQSLGASVHVRSKDIDLGPEL